MVNVTCPFPGMDPFIENQVWSDFHTRLMYGIARELGWLLAPNYQVLLETYIGVTIQPDVSIYHQPSGVETLRRSEATPATADDIVRLDVAEAAEPSHIAIRDRGGNLVTIVEVLSPANKSGSGREYYIRKRNNVLLTQVHLIEIDLLLGGNRSDNPPTESPYVALVSRAVTEPPRTGEVYHIWLEKPLPVLPVPLHGDDEVPLELQKVFATVYEESFYRLYLDYSPRRTPHLLSESERAWIDERLREAGLRE